MNPLQELRDEIKEKRKTLQETRDKAKGICALAKKEKRDLTDDESKQVDEATTLLETLTAEIKRDEQEEARASIISDTDTFLALPERRQATNDGPSNHEPRNVPEPRVPAEPRRHRSRLFRDDQTAHDMGMWVRGALFRDERAIQHCLNRGVCGSEVRAMSTNVNTAGGYVVPDAMSATVIRLVEENGVALRECQVFPMTTDTLPIPIRTAGVTLYFVGEGSPATESSPTVGQAVLTARKAVGYTYLSTELVEDAAIDVADLVTLEQAYAIADKMDDCLFNGDGTSTYGGIVGLRPKGIRAAHSASEITATSGDDTFAEVLEADLLLAVGALPMYAQAGAAWYTSNQGWAGTFLRLITAAGGTTMTEMANGIRVPVFQGYRVVRSPKMPAGAATDYSDVAMFFLGDLRQGVAVGMRRDIRMQMLTELRAQQGQVVILSTIRFDINCHGMGDTSTAGPIITFTGN